MENKNNYGIPAAIVIAGLLIAGAVIFGPSISQKAGQGADKGGSQTADKTLDPERYAKDIGLNAKAFATCMADPKTEAKITADATDATNAGAQGTPYPVVIGPGTYTVLKGAAPLADVKAAVDAALAKAASGAPVPTGADKIAPITATDHIQGSPTAPVKIIEYSDLECPFCAFFHPTLQQIMKEYGPTGKVALVYRHFPLEQIHDAALPLAKGSECAKILGGEAKFWEYIDAVFAARLELINKQQGN